jgi:A118 family predicted phage portal protein
LAGLKNIMSKVRGWVGSMLGGLLRNNKEISDIVQTQISSQHYKELEIWRAIYAGFYSEWHKLSYSTIDGKKERRRQSLHMAKISAAELAKLVFSESVEINISDEGLEENIENVLDNNRFYKLFQGKVEQMFALGGLVLKAFPKVQDDGTTKLLISYVTPDCFIPITWENDIVSEGAFINVKRQEDKLYYLFEIHKWQNSTDEAGNPVKIYNVRNRLFVKDARAIDNSGLKEVQLSVMYPELQEETNIAGLSLPLFQYIKPNIANNFELTSPLGVSIYANALDTLYAIDVAFDSFIREFRLGRRRIIVPAQAVRSIVDPNTGEMHRYFDAEDEVYQAMNFSDPEKQKITDNTVALRVEEHISALNCLLNIYAMQSGFSNGTFTFDGNMQVKTATEVISENSKTYETVKASQRILEEALENFIKTLSEVAALYDIFPMPDGEYDVEFNWDDSIIGDKYTDADFYIKLNQNGLYSKKRAIMKILNVTEEEAMEILAEVQEEDASAAPDINDVLNQTNPMAKMQSDNQDNTDTQSKTDNQDSED